MGWGSSKPTDSRKGPSGTAPGDLPPAARRAYRDTGRADEHARVPSDPDHLGVDPYTHVRPGGGR